MKNLILLCLVIFSFSISAFAQTAPQPQAAIPKADAFKNADITYKLIPAPNNTWGYDIYVDKKMMVHQPAIPAMPGNEGFKTKADAEKVAKLVVTKMKSGEMPPSVMMEELKKLKVIN